MRWIRGFIVGWCCWRLATAAAWADESRDKVIAERLSRRIQMDHERDAFCPLVKRLSEAMEIPIEPSPFFKATYTSGISTQIKVGEQPAKDLLELILWSTCRESATYLIAEDEQKRAPFRIVLVRRKELAKMGLIVPPYEQAEAEVLVAERLARRVNLDAENMPAGEYLRRLRAVVELPIELDAKSVEAIGGVPNPAFTMTEGERPAKELLELVLTKACGEPRWRYVAADDHEKRTPMAIRIVAAPRETLEQNPARFTRAEIRPTVDAGITTLLQKPVTVEIPSVRLEFALLELGRSAGVPVGHDHLELSKIGVMNAKLSVQATQKPLGTVIKQIVDTVDPKRQLVCVAYRVPIGRVALHITTRAEAERNAWKVVELLREGK